MKHIPLTQLHAHLSAHAVDWLTHPGSLTKRLRETTPDITHYLLWDDWGKADTLSLTTLSLDNNTPTWIRHMQWRCGEAIWIVGDVVIPSTSITDNTIELKEVGKKAIGEILFQDPHLQTSEFSFFALDEHTWRRSRIMHYKSQPLLIHETFQHAFFEAI